MLGSAGDVGRPTAARPRCHIVPMAVITGNVVDDEAPLVEYSRLRHIACRSASVGILIPGR
jgi:hypothetical protein